MKRRTFLKTAALGGGVAAAAAAAGLLSSCDKTEEKKGSAPAVSKGMKEIRMVTSWPKNFPGLGTAANRIGEQLTAATDGRYTVKVYAAGELVHGLKCLDAVQEGTADMYHSAEYYYQGKLTAFSFFAAVPFGLTATESSAWIHHGGGQALWDEVSAQFNVKPFMGGNTGVQMGGWFKKEMKTLEDFKGLKMRIPGLGGDVINALGGTSVTLAGGEILPALQAGTVDATEWVGPWNDLAFGFYKVVKNYYYPGFHEPGTILSCGLSKKMWDSLSASDKVIFSSVISAANEYSLAEFNANNSSALETLVTKHGVKLHEFSDTIFEGIGKTALDVVATAGNKDPLTKKVYDSFMAFRKIAKGWSGLSDQAYMTKRALVKG